MTSNNDSLAERFSNWIDAAFVPQPPARIIAFNLNLYDSPFRVGLVGSARFDKDDQDWACEEDWVANDRFFDFPEELGALPWSNRLSLVVALLTECLQSKTETGDILRNAQAVAVGFVDGDLELVYKGSA